MRLRKTRGPHAASQHHCVRLDRAGLRLDARCAAIADEDAHGRRVLEQQGPVPPCAAGQCPCCIQRVHLSVGGHVKRAQHSFKVHMGPQGGGLLDREQMAFDLHPDSVVMGAAKLLHPHIGQSEVHASILLVARGLPGLGFKLAEEPCRVFRQFGLCRALPQLTHDPCGVPCRAAGNLPALQEHGALDSSLCQVIDGRAPDNPAPDHDNRCLGGQRSGHREGSAAFRSRAMRQDRAEFGPAEVRSIPGRLGITRPPASGGCRNRHFGADCDAREPASGHAAR